MSDAPLARTDPEEVGFSSSRLRRIGAALRSEIEAGLIPGAVVGIMRAGRLVHLEAVGYRDRARSEPLASDAIFSIASMTKPLTSVAMLQLAEEGRVLLTDPIAKYLPAMAELKVAPAGTGALRAPARAPTLHDLLCHASGFTYRERGTTPAHALYPGSSIVAAQNLAKDEVVAKLAQSPLLFDPGTEWEYGFSTDVLGFVVEAVAGQPLGTFLEQRLFAPLGMVDTGFALPAAKRGRYALALATDPVTGNANPTIHHAGEGKLHWDSGGGGAVSSATDYLRFAAMLLAGGKHGSEAILGRGTVALMTADHLIPPAGDRIAATMDPGARGYGFGLGVAVRRQGGLAPMAGSAGDYYWSGVYGTYFWNDPREAISAVFMAAAPGAIRLRYRQLLRNLVYGALT
jgi:CubicO group peptidase (beta-lactamase class C family)